MDSGCREGNCGTCQVAVRSGEVEYLRPPSFEYQAGTCLTCCSIPKSAIELDA
ncbi:MAG: 2Fe-2S iron-sulfur cluster-binding protein [Candidatus Binatia bacterium]